MLAGADFFTVEVLKWRGLVTYYGLFFIHLETRRITIAGITPHPDGEWMEQIARRATQEGWGYLSGCRYVLHDRDKKFCASFRSVLTAAGVKPILLPAKSPNLKAYVSYCTLSGVCNIESRLLGLPASLAFENRVLVHRFV